MERARRFERPTLTLARLCSTPELRPHSVGEALNRISRPAPQEVKWKKMVRMEFSLLTGNLRQIETGLRRHTVLQSGRWAARDELGW